MLWEFNKFAWTICTVVTFLYQATFNLYYWLVSVVLISFQHSCKLNKVCKES